ncbi:hypothetical protein RclHR1_10080004 [Rhizophagus clarus]|uniref:DUF7431 domain-containing protein n=1 Tax=Rhizophagus clarus TaxID=94130 RepID=A0A2Z6QF10_9GLOM|nr:hypothetical protein RclHR1_10080004 [Rhizophagus clarus]
MSFAFGSFFTKKVNSVEVKIVCIDPQKTLQTINLNLSDNLSKVRQRLEEKDIMNPTLSFVEFSENDNNEFTEITFENEEDKRLSEIVRKIEEVRILTLTTCSKFKKINWKILNKLRKLDYGCTMTFDGIKKADKRAFEMKSCELKEFGNEECKPGEFRSKSIEDLMKNKNLFFNADFNDDVNVKYFVNLGIEMSNGTSNNCPGQSVGHYSNYSYNFMKYGKASLELNFENLKANPEFIKVVENAISSKKPGEQFKQIIKDFGQFIPTEIILGGRFHHDESTNRYTEIIGGEKLNDIKDFHIGNWISSLDNYKNWDCIEFRNPISIFQLLPKDLHERIIRSVGTKIHCSIIENCDFTLEDFKKPIRFKLDKIPNEVKKIIKKKDIDCKIFATVTDTKKSKYDFFTCQVLCPSDGSLPSLIIHRVKNEFKLFEKKRECKLKIGLMVIGYYEDFEFDFNTRLDILHYDFDSSDTGNLIKYDSQVPICLGIPVLSEYPKNESLIIGYYYHIQEEKDKNNEIKTRAFAYCLKNNCTVNLPKFTFYTLKITNYHNQRACNTITLTKREYINLGTKFPNFVSIYSTEQTNCIFLKQRNGQIKIKNIGNDETNLPVKFACFDPYTVI